MSAESIMDEIAERTGWNDASKLALALAYIDNQCSDDAWQDFLERQVAAVTEGSPESLPLLDTQTTCPKCGSTILSADGDDNEEVTAVECEMCHYRWLEPSEVTCKFCRKACRSDTAHLHQGSWVGDECCWDERLRSTE